MCAKNDKKWKCEIINGQTHEYTYYEWINGWNEINRCNYYYIITMVQPEHLISYLTKLPQNFKMLVS